MHGPNLAGEAGGGGMTLSLLFFAMIQPAHKRCRVPDGKKARLEGPLLGSMTIGQEYIQVLRSGFVSDL